MEMHRGVTEEHGGVVCKESQGKLTWYQKADFA